MRLFMLDQSSKLVKLSGLSNKFALLRTSVYVLLGVVLMAASAQFVIPLEPVPLTFQSTAVILLGMLYGRRLGTLSLMTYLMVGGLGLPVFAHLSSGFGVFSGATAGYLLGFIPAVWLSGWFAEKKLTKNIACTFALSIVAVSFIFICGISVLAQFIGLKQAVLSGLAPFVLTELAKLFMVSLIVQYHQKKHTQIW